MFCDSPIEKSQCDANAVANQKTWERYGACQSSWTYGLAGVSWGVVFWKRGVDEWNYSSHKTRDRFFAVTHIQVKWIIVNKSCKSSIMNATNA